MSASWIGDFNNDTYPDIAVGASRSDDNGMIYLIFLQSSKYSLSEACDAGMYCENGVECSTDATLCDGVGDGLCAPRSRWDVIRDVACNSECQLNVCGDGDINYGTDNEPGGAYDIEECDP